MSRGLPEEQTGWLAALKGLSRSALADRFTRLIGEPPIRYLARWRIQVAAHQLRNTDAPLARIAEQVGYESEAAFNRAFKRSFGVPHATWRKNAPVAPGTLDGAS